MTTSLRPWSRRLLILGALVALITLFAATPARAADTRGGQNVVIGRGEVIEGDLYVAANTLTVDGTIKGDLVAMAGQITVNGTITGDLLAGAQAIVINGTIGDDARVGGQAIDDDDVQAQLRAQLAGGGVGQSQPGSAVEGDVLLGAYQGLLSGTVGKSVRGGLNRLELRGTVGGDVDVSISDDKTDALRFTPAGQLPIPTVPPSLTLADSARIGGKLIYHSPASASISPSSQVASGISFDEQPPAAQPAATTTAWWVSYARRLASLLLIGLLLVWLLPLWTRRLADSVEARPLPSLGWGLVAFFAFLAAVIAVVVLTIALAILFGYLTLSGLVGMIVTLGLLSGAAMVAGYVAFAAYLAQAIVGYMAGRWLLRRLQPAWVEQPFVPLIVGVVLYVILRAIPWLGGLLALLVVLLALGALWEWGRATLHRPRATPAPVAGFQPA